MLRTRFTEMFDVRHPVMSAPMAGHSSGGLAAAVSEAGALGSFGGMGPAIGRGWITEQVAVLRRTTRRPFVIGFITPFLDAVRPLFDEALEQRPDAVCLSFSDPGPWADRVRESGAKLICQVQDLESAAMAVDAGADVLIAQGTEAGGHTGSMSLLPLLASVVERHPDVPVLAAGGIGDGASMAEAMVAGADGVMMGTAFLATVEATDIDDIYKELIVASDGTDTVLTDAYDIVGGYPFPAGISDRVRANRFTREWAGREDELWSHRDDLGAHVAHTGRIDPDIHAVRYGQSAGLVKQIRSVAEVVDSIVQDAERILRSRPAELRTD